MERRIIVVIFGIAQSAIGVLFAFLTVLLFVGVVEIQTIFKKSSELFLFYLLVLSLFSLFSIISGIFLIREFRR